MEVRYRPTPFLANVLGGCPTLRAPYRPTPWARNCHLQIGLLALADRREPSIRFDEREVLTLGDGGVVGLAWSGLDLDGRTPTLVVLPTVCGDAHSMRPLVHRMRRLLGWRVVVLDRRGHGALPLRTPRFDMLGSVDDLRAQLDAVCARVPEAPLYAVGASAGSALLVRHLGEAGAATPFSAAIAWCPGYDTTRAFARVHAAYDRYLTRLLKAHFLVRHARTLAGEPGYAAALESRTVLEFQARCHGFAGHASLDAYHAATNPMVVAGRIRVPLLVLNAADDPVCTLENVREHQGLVDEVRESLLVLTPRGSHCAFFEGMRRPTSWAHRVMAEYLRAVEATRNSLTP